MMKPFMGFEFHRFIVVHMLVVSIVYVQSQSSSNDTDVMEALKANLSPPKTLDWSDAIPCRWHQIQCSKDGRVTRIQVGNQGLKGVLPRALNHITELQVLEFQNNQLTGPLLSLAGLSQLQNILLNYNNF